MSKPSQNQKPGNSFIWFFFHISPQLIEIYTVQHCLLIFMIALTSFLGKMFFLLNSGKIWYQNVNNFFKNTSVCIEPHLNLIYAFCVCWYRTPLNMRINLVAIQSANVNNFSFIKYMTLQRIFHFKVHINFYMYFVTFTLQLVILPVCC